ncbi:MAG TPA: Clp protease N-terminal domain-containing protein [Terriglobales bacterium]|nr:Clp protease N-terminal domain-containing protein [Terriglobales bacterium]
MFEKYSDRARMVVFTARYRSGKHGAPAIDVDHLVDAIVFEDQGKLADALDEPGRVLSPNFEPKAHFFSSEIASELLVKIYQLFQIREPIPTSVDMPLSDGVNRTFAAAMTMIAELSQNQVTPLHLLAASFSEQSKAEKLMMAAGITGDDVIRALKGDS